MASEGKELEVKFYISDLRALETRLRQSGARLVQPRVREVNLRFDTEDGDLSRTRQVLRLRQDNQAWVTYKGPGKKQSGARLRKELEFTVSDFDNARGLFESLGYRVVVIYEKYRAVYALGQALVTLDEMPYGDFIEIEGPDGNTIRASAGALGLVWKRRILDSYLALFERVRIARGLDFRDLTFENFKGMAVAPEDLDAALADVG